MANIDAAVPSNIQLALAAPLHGLATAAVDAFANIFDGFGARLTAIEAKLTSIDAVLHAADSLPSTIASYPTPSVTTNSDQAVNSIGLNGISSSFDDFGRIRSLPISSRNHFEDFGHFGEEDYPVDAQSSLQRSSDDNELTSETVVRPTVLGQDLFAKKLPAVGFESAVDHSTSVGVMAPGTQGSQGTFAGRLRTREATQGPKLLDTGVIRMDPNNRKTNSDLLRGKLPAELASEVFRSSTPKRKRSQTLPQYSQIAAMQNSDALKELLNLLRPRNVFPPPPKKRRSQMATRVGASMQTHNTQRAPKKVIEESDEEGTKSKGDTGFELDIDEISTADSVESEMERDVDSASKLLTQFQAKP